MPELPEVEVLVRHLRPLLRRRKVLSVTVNRPKVVRPDSVLSFREGVVNHSFETVDRRGKYLVFQLLKPGRQGRLTMLGHLGMAGRLYLQPTGSPLPKHTAVILQLDGVELVFEDPRYFGRLSLSTSALEKLGLEPLSPEFTQAALSRLLASSRLPIKPALMSQPRIAGIGNIYASEILHRALISPFLPANVLTRSQIGRLHRATLFILREAVRFGSTVPLAFGQDGTRNGLFYYGQATSAPSGYEERLSVYDRKNLPCSRCGDLIQRVEQAGRSTYYCPTCQS